MEAIESGLVQLEKHNKDAIEKHNSILMKTIFDFANKSHTSATSFDSNFRNLFPEMHQVDSEPSSVFNPHTVCEFRNGIAYQVIESWDKDYGVLPNRKVMSKYYLDEGHVFTPEDNGINAVTISYCKAHDKPVIVSFSEGRLSYRTVNTISCGCSHNCNFNNFRTLSTVGPKHKRGEERYNFFSKQEYEFEVDNYLNLYHVETGLYLMFNKTVFSALPFCLSKMYLSSRDTTFIENSEFNKTFTQQHPYYQIFTSKRLNTKDKTFKIEQSYYKSKDSRDLFLEQINQLVPYDYLYVYDLFNRFRQFDGFVSNVGNEQGRFAAGPNIRSENSEDTGYLNEKDRLIKAMEIRLNETVSRAEEAEKVVSDMTKDYSEKSIQVQSLTRELNLNQLKLEESRQEFEHKLSKYAVNEREITCDKIEELERECFNLKQRLLQSSVFKTQAEGVGESLNSSKKDNERLSLDVKRLKDMNKDLVKQISTEKNRNDNVTDNNRELVDSIKTIKQKESTSNIVIAKLNKDIKILDASNKLLTDKLGNMGDSSTNVLERALGDQVHDLQTRLSDLQKNNVNLDSKNKQLNCQIDKFKQLISSFGSQI